MSKYDNCNTLEEAIAVWQELDPWSERTISGKAEAIILQAVREKKLVPVVDGEKTLYCTDEYYGDWYACKVCGKSNMLPSAKFCPDCGARFKT